MTEVELTRSAEETPKKRGRPALPLGENGKITLVERSPGRWEASCRFRDRDGTRQVARSTPPRFKSDPGGAEALAELHRELRGRRKMLGLEGWDRRQPLPFSPHGYYVYLLWGDRRYRPLYVGQSRNVLRRIGQHVSDYGELINDVDVIPCDSQEEMTSIEQAMIEALSPMWNFTFNGTNRILPTLPTSIS